MLAPAATPPEVVRRLNAEAVKIIRSPELGKRMAGIGAEPIGDSTEEMARRIRVDTERFAKLVKEANVTVQ